MASFEGNPFRNDPPLEVQRVSRPLYDYLLSLSNNIRKQHTLNQAGAPTYSVDFLFARYRTPEFPLGSRGRFVDENYGVIQSVFVRFAAPNDGTPRIVGWHSKDINLHVVTSVFADSNDGYAVGIDLTSGPGDYGWVVVEGFLPTPCNFGISATQVPATFGWTGNNTAGLSSSPFLQLTKRSDAAIPAGSLRVMSDGLGARDGLDLAPILADIDSLQDQLAALQALVDGFNSRVVELVEDNSVTYRQEIDNLERSVTYITRRQTQFNPDSVIAEMENSVRVVADFYSLMTELGQVIDDQAQRTVVRAEAARIEKSQAKAWNDSAGVHASVSSERAAFAAVKSAESETWAGVSEGYSVTAGEAAAEAQTWATTAANAGGASLLKNPNFADFPNAATGGIPTHWGETDSFDTGLGYRVSDIDGTYAHRLISTAGTYCYLSQRSEVGAVKYNDWLVIDCDFVLRGGTMQAAGFLVRTWSPDLAEHADIGFPLQSYQDINGRPLSDPGVGVPIHVQIPVHITHVNASIVDLFYMNHWDGLAELSTAPANDIEWRKVNLRRATLDEIRGETIYLGSAAQVSILTSTVATLNSSVGSLSLTVSSHTTSITNINNDVNTVNNNLNTLSGQVNAQATSISGLTTNYSSLSFTVSSHSTSISDINNNVNTVNNNLNTVSGQVNAQAVSISDLTSNYSSLSFTVSSHTTSISGLNGSVTSLTATVSAQAGAINDLYGRNSAWLSFTVEAGTGRAMVSLNASGQSGSNIDLVANRLRFFNGGTALPPTMQVESGKVTIAGDLFMGGGRIVASNGANMMVQGQGFGSANQFLMWAGPYRSNFADCTEALATMYFKTDGSAYFGGGLSSGVLKNEGTSTTVSETAAIVVGPFASNGDTVNVNFSCTYARYQSANAGTGGISGSGSATLTLQWSNNGGASWNTLGSVGVTEYIRDVHVDGDPGVRDAITWGMSAAAAASWSPGAISGILLRAVWSGFTLPGFGGSGLTLDGQTQTTTVVAIEL